MTEVQGEVIETRGHYRVWLVPDNDAPNPRIEFDTACGAVTLYDHDCDPVPEPGPLDWAWDRLCATYDRDKAAETFTRYARIIHGAEVLFDSPHRGPAAVWYLTDAEARRHGITDKMAALKAERDEYRAWAESDVYGFIVKKLVHWTPDDTSYAKRDTWEHVASCWGFYGYDYAEAEARGALEQCHVDNAT